MTSTVTPVMTTIAMVIVNYNTCKELHSCLASIARDDAAEIIVVDNGSTDDSVEMVRACYPHVALIAIATNCGYGAAANQAIEHCHHDYILLLNSDTILAPDSARSLKLYLDQHPQAAIVGPRLTNPDGTLQPSCYPYPTPFNLFLEESLLGRLIAYLPALRNHFLRTWSHDKTRSVPWVLGAALAIRRSAFQAVKGFDPTFFMYFEETDLCMRLGKAGWQTHFAPITTIVHVGGASTSQHYAEMQYRLYCSTKHFYHHHYAGWQLRAYHLAMLPIIAARLVRDALRWRRTRSMPEREKSLATLHVRLRLLRECALAFVL
jgi:GT2 family glycosyltransferase